MKTLTFGPVRCAWWPYRRGESAQAPVCAWLAQEWTVAPAALGMRRDQHGRPRLEGGPQGCDANWSHSGELLLAAHARDRCVGVDLEWLRPRPKALSLAQRFFTAPEVAWLSSFQATPERLERQFVRLWCAKEAILKAHGRGLAFGLDRLQVALEDDEHDPRATPRLIACAPALGAPEDWNLRAWMPQPGYLATVAWRATTA